MYGRVSSGGKKGADRRAERLVGSGMLWKVILSTLNTWLLKLVDDDILSYDVFPT